MSYASYTKREDGTFDVETPGRGFTLIDKLDDENLAFAIVRCINKAHKDGKEDIRHDFRMLMDLQSGEE